MPLQNTRCPTGRVPHAPDCGIIPCSYGRGLVCCWRQGISPEPNSDNTRLTFRLFIQAAKLKIEKDMLPLRMKTAP